MITTSDFGWLIPFAASLRMASASAMMSTDQFAAVEAGVREPGELDGVQPGGEELGAKHRVAVTARVGIAQHVSRDFFRVNVHLGRAAVRRDAEEDRQVVVSIVPRRANRGRYGSSSIPSSGRRRSPGRCRAVRGSAPAKATALVKPASALHRRASRCGVHERGRCCWRGRAGPLGR